jgi:hypothetical protein
LVTRIEGPSYAIEALARPESDERESMNSVSGAAYENGHVARHDHAAQSQPGGSGDEVPASQVVRHELSVLMREAIRTN